MVALDTALLAGRQVSGGLIRLSLEIRAAMEKTEVEQEGEFRESLDVLVREKGQFVKLLREKSGMDFMGEEFLETLHVSAGKDESAKVAAKLKREKGNSGIDEHL